MKGLLSIVAAVAAVVVTGSLLPDRRRRLPRRPYQVPGTRNRIPRSASASLSEADFRFTAVSCLLDDLSYYAILLINPVEDGGVTVGL